MEQLSFREPWRRVDREPAEQEGLRRQLEDELLEGHVLHGRSVEVVARDDASDDIVVRLDDGRYAMVSLFEPSPAVKPRWWRRTGEYRPGGPDTEVYDDPERLQADLEAHYRLWAEPPAG